jgi:haloalkane dehalogenase
MEAIALPRRWEDFGEAGALFRGIRSEAGEDLILNGNAFVETILPRSVVRTLTGEEMSAYRAPFVERESRWPTLIWPREIPIDGEPADVKAIVEANGSFMAASPIPKLLVVGEPGAIMTGRTREFCRTWPNQREVTVRGRHFLQEDSPHQIGAALAEFISSMRA